MCGTLPAILISYMFLEFLQSSKTKCLVYQVDRAVPDPTPLVKLATVLDEPLFDVREL